jgi:hypothetical protein
MEACFKINGDFVFRIIKSVLQKRNDIRLINNGTINRFSITGFLTRR